MRELRIGILDSEDRYVEKLTGVLNRHNGWRAIGFTAEESLAAYLEKRELSMLLATDRTVLLRLPEKCGSLCPVWLAEGREEGFESIRRGSCGKNRNGQADGRQQEDAWEPDPGGMSRRKRTDGSQRESDWETKWDAGYTGGMPDGDGIYRLYRFQSAGQIVRCVEEIAARSGLFGRESISMLAVCSPVGRCGKTILALRLAERDRGLYLGMEDYGSFPEEEELMADRFYYYVKERRADRVAGLLVQCGGRIATGSSPFDMKQIGAAELGWLREQVEQMGSFQRIVVDLGTGVVEEPEFFAAFDGLIVPYLAKEGHAKEGRLKRLLKKAGVGIPAEQVRYVNMEQGLDLVVEELIRAVRL